MLTDPPEPKKNWIAIYHFLDFKFYLVTRVAAIASLVADACGNLSISVINFSNTRTNAIALVPKNHILSLVMKTVASSNQNCGIIFCV